MKADHHVDPRHISANELLLRFFAEKARNSDGFLPWVIISIIFFAGCIAFSLTHNYFVYGDCFANFKEPFYFASIFFIAFWIFFLIANWFSVGDDCKTRNLLHSKGYEWVTLQEANRLVREGAFKMIGNLPSRDELAATLIYEEGSIQSLIDCSNTLAQNRSIGYGKTYRQARPRG